MRYAIVFGSDMFVGTSGVLSYESATGEIKEFFRVREVHRELSEGSYLTLDVDVKDNNGDREIKLFKSKPVASNENIKVEFDKTQTVVYREDGSIVIKVEQLDSNDASLPINGPVREYLDSGKIEAVIRITGKFDVGKWQIESTTEGNMINTNRFGGNLSIGTGGLVLRQNGFSF